MPEELEGVPPVRPSPAFRPTLAHLIGMVVGVFLIGFFVAYLFAQQRTRLTVDTPVARVDETFMVQLATDTPARVEVQSQPIEAGYPERLTPASPLYDVQARGAVQAIFTVDDMSAQYDVYQWDGDAWQFMASLAEPQYGRIVVDEAEGQIALFEVTPEARSLAATASPKDTVDAETAVALNTIFATGYMLTEDGITTDVETGFGVPAVPVITPAGDEAAPAFLERRVREQQTIIAQFVDASQVDRFAFDLGPNLDGERLLRLLESLQETDVQVGVVLPMPTLSAGELVTHGYDWFAIGQVADFVIIELQTPPTEYATGGMADRVARYAVGQVSREKVYFALSALSLDQWASRSTPIGYTYALAPLQGMTFFTQSSMVALNPQPGDPLGFRAQGEARNIMVDPTTGALTYSVFAGDGEHRIWLTTGHTLHHKLQWLNQYGQRGVIADGLFDEDTGPLIKDAIRWHRFDEEPAPTPDFTLGWAVENADGETVLTRETSVAEPLVWIPETEGDYVVRSTLRLNGDEVQQAEHPISVEGATIGLVSDYENVVTGAPDIQTDQPTAAPAPPAVNPNLAPPVRAPSAPGGFELGGQVNHVIYNPGKMRQAGMRWVKFQVAWEENMSPDVVVPLLEQGEAEGFKVLLSVTGQVKYPGSINYEAYIEFLRQIAYYGPDAIEIWNEGNIVFEWPRGEINGATYVEELLAPGYNAIKEVNPNIMVISMALAPTGAFFADGGCAKDGNGCDDWLYLQQMAEAGAANYMDCTGVHFNAGATSPYAQEGHPADPGYQHYSWYFGSMVELYGGTFGRPLCFTELGYLSGDGYGAVPQRFSWASGTSVAEQAQWLAETAEFSRELDNVRMVIVWNVDFVYWGEDPMAGYAIVRPDGSCPACTTLGNVMR